MIEFENENKSYTPLTDDELEICSECVKTVGSTFKVTRNADGTIFSTTQEVTMVSDVPKGGDFRTQWDFQRIQCTNKINNDYNNKRVKSPVNK